MKSVSGWLQVVGVVAVFVGVVGILAGLFEMFTIVVGPLQGNYRRSAAFGAPSEQVDLAREMNRQIRDLLVRWRPVTVPLLVVNLLVSVGLIVSGMQTLRMRPAGRSRLVVAFGAAMILALIQVAPKTMMQMETSKITAEFTSKMMDAAVPDGRKPPPEVGGVLTVMTTAISVVGIVVMVVFKLVEVGFYVFGLIYLRRPNVREQFAGPIVAELA